VNKTAASAAQSAMKCILLHAYSRSCARSNKNFIQIL